MCVAGFGTSSESRRVPEKSRGCHDASIGESYLTLAFSDRLECWDLQKEEDSPSWSMEIAVEGSGMAYPHVRPLTFSLSTPQPAVK